MWRCFYKLNSPWAICYHHCIGRVLRFLFGRFKARLNSSGVTFPSRDHTSTVSLQNYHPFSKNSGGFNTLRSEQRFVLIAVCCVTADDWTHAVRFGSWSPGARAAGATFDSHVTAFAVAAWTVASPRRSRRHFPDSWQPCYGESACPHRSLSASPAFWSAAASARAPPAAGSAAPSSLLSSPASRGDVSRGRAVSSEVTHQLHP